MTAINPSIARNAGVNSHKPVGTLHVFLTQKIPTAQPTIFGLWNCKLCGNEVKYLAVGILD